ncbi:exonuclease III [Lactobacillus hominis DSM 23910 = CRBIP 24.179]|uniref:Exodeoxyribonuclease III n=2 Tax=Lactobacillus hominis TaxID=1203033 RepID=I7KHX0_9LACO|nr:exonuclease III [Lactobacillus hominis DSM 23910 = CRBIP 24.179]CCI82475.1 Exodeoxyribonuclease III [Lactobacillus hominis DSM 23910 = CRBIP 24.179]
MRGLDKERRITMKFISWNVNGFRAAMRHGFLDTFKELNADIFGMQDIRLSPNEVSIDTTGYYQYWNYSKEKSFDGTAIFTKIKPLAVANGIGVSEFDQQGRTITLEYPNFYFVTTYVPFSGEQLQRLDFRIAWDQAFRKYLLKLEANKPVIIGGDMSVAHEPIDLAQPSENHHHAGFTEQERDDFTKLLNSGFTDTFRYLHPNEKDIYSYWSYRYHGREKNEGWRLDYILVSNSLDSKIKKANILTEIPGSDHCPVSLEMDISAN